MRPRRYACTLLLVSLGALAGSRSGDGVAMAVLRDDLPCFYLPSSGAADTLQLTVRPLRHRNDAISWRLQRPAGDSAPADSAHCIRYGDSTGNAPPLRQAEPYCATLENGKQSGRVYFCLASAADGQTMLGQVDERGRCSSEPLSAKPGFWRHWLGL